MTSAERDIKASDGFRSKPLHKCDALTGNDKKVVLRSILVHVMSIDNSIQSFGITYVVLGIDEFKVINLEGFLWVRHCVCRWCGGSVDGDD